MESSQKEGSTPKGRGKGNLFQKPPRCGPRGKMRGDVDFSELYGKRVDPDEVKEIKVMIPSTQHTKLHGYKVLTGKTISSMVNEALDLYFSRKTADRVPALEIMTHACNSPSACNLGGRMPRLWGRGHGLLEVGQTGARVLADLVAIRLLGRRPALGRVALLREEIDRLLAAALQLDLAAVQDIPLVLESHGNDRVDLQGVGIYPLRKGGP